MKFLKEHLRLYAVTDRKNIDTATLLHRIEQAISGGVTMVQLREKDLDEEALKKEAKKVQAICKKYGVPFIVNDIVLLAKENTKIAAERLQKIANEVIA